MNIYCRKAENMARARSNSTAGFLINKFKKSARRLSLVRFTNRAESIDSDHQLLCEDTKMLRIRNQMQLTLEKQQKRESRKNLRSRYDRENENEYVPYEEMGTVAILLFIVFIIFVFYVAEQEISEILSNK